MQHQEPSGTRSCFLCSGDLMHEFILISNGFQRGHPVAPTADVPNKIAQKQRRVSHNTLNRMTWVCVIRTHILIHLYTYIHILELSSKTYIRIHWIYGIFFRSLTFLSKSPVWWPKRHQCHQCHAMATAPYQAGCSLEGRDPWLGYVVNNYGNTDTVDGRNPAPPGMHKTL